MRRSTAFACTPLRLTASRRRLLFTYAAAAISLGLPLNEGAETTSLQRSFQVIPGDVKEHGGGEADGIDAIEYSGMALN